MLLFIEVSLYSMVTVLHKGLSVKNKIKTKTKKPNNPKTKKQLTAHLLIGGILECLFSKRIKVTLYRTTVNFTDKCQQKKNKNNI